MTKHHKLFAIITATFMVAGCGPMVPQATAPQPAAPQAATTTADTLAQLPADASVVNAETGYTVQQSGSSNVYGNDGRVRLAYQDDNNVRLGRMDDDDDRRMMNMRNRFDDDRRLRVLQPKFQSLLLHPSRFLISPFHRQYPIFINVHDNRIFRLNPAAFIILKRLFPELDDATIWMLIRRLVLLRNLNVYHDYFPFFFFNVHRRVHIPHHGFPHRDRDRDYGDRDGRGGYGGDRDGRGDGGGRGDGDGRGGYGGGGGGGRGGSGRG